jgi:hypothetical protein
MSQYIKLKGQISEILTRKDLAEELVKRLQETRFIVMREYFKEAPVNLGDLRRYIFSKGKAGGYVVSTSASNNGKSYPLYVHQGTGRFKNVQADFPSTGRVRSGESRMNRGDGGIRPNKFAKRAAERSQPLVINYMSDVVSKLSSSLVGI